MPERSVAEGPERSNRSFPFYYEIVQHEVGHRDEKGGLITRLLYSVVREHVK